ncbi:hypothetical protein IA18_10990 [Bacillus subtilis subsp. subtilis]|uniref:DUF2268 domain-containing protein n=1 Tax=Bacillus subtilis TaxID=1423 RepID=UPI0004E87D88|nr:DUF2268 domain-containing protein [Bacillus subtilis]KFH33426.1 hypothetical protein IA18_10990 [Bacillus subtilis subsp. subtilis]
MNLVMEKTFEQYEKLFSMEEQKREDVFRYTMMRPFEKMWTAIQVPLKAKEPNGYDVIMAAKMLGYLDVRDAESGQKALQILKESHVSETAESALRQCIFFGEREQLRVNAKEIKFGLYIADPNKLQLQKGYCGFGGIPGFIHVWINPNSYNLPRIPSIIAHEFHHNVRFSYIDFHHGSVSVGDYLVIEGLAESFARELFGTERLGPWVTRFDHEDLQYSIDVINEVLDVKGFSEVSRYMFGDPIANDQGFKPAGLSAFAGYAVGYHAVQSFMNQHHITISEATRLDAKTIISQCGLFST